ncbi:2-oxoglutarate-Fe(II) type oxidoreductase hxnY-like [Cynara cardunculus var. scolymus]|uniref:2-oxoglutarate-Fe(II) type oxidoreductase hxnY-like n=1 Tax=Cynara cardunculus var. scolymus TaxID=59895 RepID=UPI000D630062|nr:2-oxoglutarate-Fe(II) type oxidoreductase hxnY-like [Cynara cardunculus var. scolymus]
MAASLSLPLIDLSSTDRISTANSIRQASMDYGFFYLINHGVDEQLLQNVFDESRKFFSLPLEEKMKLARKGDLGFAPMRAENLDSSTTSKGDSKETFHIGPSEDDERHINQWPSEDVLPSWRFVMEKYYKQVLSTGKQLSSLIALALNLDENFFEKAGGALNGESAVLRLLHYPGEMGVSDEVVYGASAHSDYGMITLLATDGVPGLQVCREKLKQPRIWEDVNHVKGAFIVNLGDMMERWSNCLFRSTLHRVMPTGKERYSIALFLDPNEDYIVECLPSCCSESSPPRFPPIRCGDYLRDRIDAAYSG